jgi:phenylacetic acid degradation operon negative regulatory protein
MKWKRFHHPDISLPVVRRRISEELITLLAGTAAMVISRGASEIYGHCYPSRRAYRASVARLKERGLVTHSQTDGSLPPIRLTDEGEALLPVYCNPESHWSKRWNKWWYVLMFDVPEAERKYRDALRSFLKKNRFGCLQKSVWVTPRDARADYDDLDRAASVDSVAFLFEARTVLGHGNQSVVREAWNFNKIDRIQELYIQYALENLALLGRTGAPEHELMQFLRMDNQAYAQAMSLDPLLPNELLPRNYQGKRVADLHRKLIQSVFKCL